MKNVKNAVLVALGLFIATGCATVKTIDAKVNVMRKTGGVLLAQSSSYNEGIAYDGARSKAEEHCFKEQKDFVVVKEESKYQGADKTAAGVAGAVGAFLGKNTNSKNLDDYSVRVEFKCEGKYTGNGPPFAKTLDLSRQTASW